MAQLRPLRHAAAESFTACRGLCPVGCPIEFLSPLVILYACVVMVLAYAARGASGFGAAAAMPLLSLVIPLKILVPAWTLIAGAAGIALFGSDRKRISWIDIARLIPGTLIGIAAGLVIFKTLDSATLTKVLGGFVLLYGLHSLWGTFRASAPLRVPTPLAALLGGIGGGLTGTVLGTMGSMFYAIYFDVVRLAKDNYRASMTMILLTLTVVRGLGYYAVDEFNREVLITAAVLLPSMFVGIFIGNRFHHGMSEMVFRRTVSGALIASGLALLVK